MGYKAGIRQITAVVAIAIGSTQAGCAHEVKQTAAQQQPAPAMATPAAASGASDASGATTPSAAATAAAASGAAATTARAPGSDAPTVEEAGQNARGNVAELQQLINGGELTEMRTTYNGSYGATLLLDQKNMTYYVGLFQQKAFWRVIKTTDDTRADAIYRGFVGETGRLAEAELRRIKLEGQKAMTEQLLQLTEEHENRLKADLDVAQRQQAVVATQQQREHAEVDALQAQDALARQKLVELQRQVRELENDVEGGLPTRKH